MSAEHSFTKEDVDFYFKELAKEYKKDLSDIVGIIQSQQQLGHPLSFDDIDRAMKNMYGSWDKVNSYAKLLLDKALESDDLPRLFAEQMQKVVVAISSTTTFSVRIPQNVTLPGFFACFF